MKEIWKRLFYNNCDYGDYYLISNLGRIKNVKNGTIMKNYKNKNNPYYKITLSFGNRNKQVTMRVHRAVAQTFIPNPDNLPQVNHKDGNKLNNNIENLEWVTGKQNNIHAVVNKLSRSGEMSQLSKLTSEQIEYIKEKCIPYDKNFGCIALAKKFNVDSSTISKIIHDMSWKKYDNNKYELIPNTVNNLHKRKIYSRKCNICGKNFETIDENQMYCSMECVGLSQRKTKRPSKDELIELTKTTPFTQIGKMYGVSDNTIRKWCNKYGLSGHSRDYK